MRDCNRAWRKSELKQKRHKRLYLPRILRLAVDTIAEINILARTGRRFRAFGAFAVGYMQAAEGGVPERLKGADCKSVGYAYVGSNPTPSTTPLPARNANEGTGCPLKRDDAHEFSGCSSMVEQKPSKLTTGVRFPSPAPRFRPAGD
jgi:hypothetical protein